MDKFKINLDLLEAQHQDFTNSGILLRNIFSISIRHPWLSLLFALSFGLLTNALYELLNYILTTPQLDNRIFIQLLLLTLLFILIPFWVYIRIRLIHKDLFVPTSLNKKRLLITVVSKDRSDFKQTPSYNTYMSLLYNGSGHANVNSLEKVVLIVTESSEVKATAILLKNYIEESDRKAELFTISIEEKSMMDIKKQIEILFSKLLKKYQPYELISDYTGGTKDISIALLKASEDKLITPIYLKDASINNHSKYH